MVYDSLALYVARDTYTIVQHDSNLTPLHAIVINRDTGSFALKKNVEVSTTDSQVLPIVGILGVISLLSGDYLILIGNRETAGHLNGHEIYQAKQIVPLRIARDFALLTKEQYDDETRFISLMETLFNTGLFYFSYTYDLTQTLQRQAHLDKLADEPLWKRADDHFFWNRYLQSKLIDISISDPDQDMSDFILPVIHGFIEICPTQIHNRKVAFAIISRRSRFRNGTRYFSRGIDRQGNASNFVETEQIALVDSEDPIQLSYVQTRGSIPVLWAQVSSLKYTPKMQIMDRQQAMQAAQLHFNDLINLYGTLQLLSLTNKKGYEVSISEEYERVVHQLNNPQLRYRHFDFHRECRNLQWDRIDLLIEQMKKELLEQRYFLESPQMRHEQTTTLRINCMDCLDRTNVVQSFIARWMLTEALREVGVIEQQESLENVPEFMDLFRNVWANNADAISTAYSGTGALKTDFTRTGSRTALGVFQDFQNSMQRYFSNTFLDGNRQDAYDLVTGAYQVKSDVYKSPFTDDRPASIKMAPGAFGILLGLLITTWTMTYSDDDPSEFKKYAVLIMGALTTLAAFYILNNGDQYVTWPMLVPRDYRFYQAKVQMGTRRSVELEFGEKTEMHKHK